MNDDQALANQLDAAPLVQGGVAGLLATLPMSLAMLGMQRLLPAYQRYPLPPEQITIHMVAETRQIEFLSKPLRQAATVLLHFSYGAGVGATYALVATRVPVPVPLPLVKSRQWRRRVRAALRGVVFGLGIWAVSYLGWLPAVGILAPATRHPAQRNALMITAHVIWGAATGLLVDAWRPAGNNP